MAEIKIQRRQRSPWPWILGLIILAGFVWFLLTYVYVPNDNENETAAGDTTYNQQRYQVPMDTTNEVRDFVEYSRNTNANVPPKQYTEQGLIKLQSALSYIADRTDSANTGAKANIDSLDRTIVKIDTASPNYLSQVKPAFSAAVNAIASIQGPGNQEQGKSTADLKRIESGIDASKPIASQLNQIKQFFAAAGNALQNIKLSREYTTN